MTGRRGGPQAAVLLDGNVLVALVISTHVHHQAAQAWFAAGEEPFATCPITQGVLLRLLMRLGDLRVETALGVLAELTAHARHIFRADDLDDAQVAWRGVLGHRQVTDAHLAALARRNQGHLATFDAGLAALHSDVALRLG